MSEVPGDDSSLRIRRSEFGFVQMTSYSNPDLYHEEVEELDAASLWAPRFASGTEVLSYLLLGDQNAGKSTFLHAFTHSEARSFMRLCNYLPVLSSSFVNARLLASGGRYIDEPPFLDTDLARASLLLAADDFRFLCHEQGLPTAPRAWGLGADTRFVGVTLVEVGGDHLDRVMHARAAAQDSSGAAAHRGDVDDTPCVRAAGGGDAAAEGWAGAEESGAPARAVWRSLLRQAQGETGAPQAPPERMPPAAFAAVLAHSQRLLQTAPQVGYFCNLATLLSPPLPGSEEGGRRGHGVSREALRSVVMRLALLEELHSGGGGGTGEGGGGGEATSAGDAAAPLVITVLLSRAPLGATTTSTGAERGGDVAIESSFLAADELAAFTHALGGRRALRHVLRRVKPPSDDVPVPPPTASVLVSVADAWTALREAFAAAAAGSGSASVAGAAAARATAFADSAEALMLGRCATPSPSLPPALASLAARAAGAVSSTSAPSSSAPPGTAHAAPLLHAVLAVALAALRAPSSRPGAVVVEVRHAAHVDVAADVAFSSSPSRVGSSGVGAVATAAAGPSVGGVLRTLRQLLLGRVAVPRSPPYGACLQALLRHFMDVSRRVDEEGALELYVDGEGFCAFLAEEDGHGHGHGHGGGDEEAECGHEHHEREHGHERGGEGEGNREGKWEGNDSAASDPLIASATADAAATPFTLLRLYPAVCEGLVRGGLALPRAWGLFSNIRALLTVGGASAAAGGAAEETLAWCPVWRARAGRGAAGAAAAAASGGTGLAEEAPPLSALVDASLAWVRASRYALGGSAEEERDGDQGERGEEAKRGPDEEDEEDGNVEDEDEDGDVDGDIAGRSLFSSYQSLDVGGGGGGIGEGDVVGEGGHAGGDPQVRLAYTPALLRGLFFFALGEHAHADLWAVTPNRPSPSFSSRFSASSRRPRAAETAPVVVAVPVLGAGAAAAVQADLAGRISRAWARVAAEAMRQATADDVAVDVAVDVASPQPSRAVSALVWLLEEAVLAQAAGGARSDAAPFSLLLGEGGAAAGSGEGAAVMGAAGAVTAYLLRNGWVRVARGAGEGGREGPSQAASTAPSPAPALTSGAFFAAAPLHVRLRAP